MLKWFKKLSGTEKGMLIVIIILVAGIIIRWDYVSDGIGKAWKARFAPAREETVRTDTIPEPKPVNDTVLSE